MESPKSRRSENTVGVCSLLQICPLLRFLHSVLCALMLTNVHILFFHPCLKPRELVLFLLCLYDMLGRHVESCEYLRNSMLRKKRLTQNELNSSITWESKTIKTLEVSHYLGTWKIHNLGFPTVQKRPIKQSQPWYLDIDVHTILRIKLNTRVIKLNTRVINQA